jgi:ABC-type sugar transport system permease subunit
MIFLMSEGGPAYDNYTLAIYALQLTWTRMEVGYASALAILLSIVLLLVSVVYIRRIERSREWM